MTPKRIHFARINLVFLKFPVNLHSFCPILIHMSSSRRRDCRGRRGGIRAWSKCQRHDPFRMCGRQVETWSGRTIPASQDRREEHRLEGTVDAPAVAPPRCSMRRAIRDQSRQAPFGSLPALHRAFATALPRYVLHWLPPVPPRAALRSRRSVAVNQDRPTTR